METEFAWLIESVESEVSAPRYWAGSFGDESNLWTDNHLQAVRLCRKEDAEKIAKGVLAGYKIRICEHGWG